MIKGLIFDLNGTVINILTDESNKDIYRVMANLLNYQGVYLQADEVKKLFYEYNQKQRKQSLEEYPEFSVTEIFSDIIENYGSEFTKELPQQKLKFLPQFLAEAFRAAALFRLKLYPEVRETLDELKKQYRMAAVSDGQTAWAVPEMYALGLGNDFELVLVSGDFGFRKPDLRMYQIALEKMDLLPEEVIFIGNDMYRDVWGAHQAGMKTIFFQSNQGDHRPREVEADYIIYDFNQLFQAIDFLSK